MGEVLEGADAKTMTGAPSRNFSEMFLALL